MKTSLLLLGLALGVGMVGTARAADATNCTRVMHLESQSLANDGLLSDLGNMVSGHQNKSDADTSTGNASSGSSYRRPPGPDPSRSAQGNHAHATGSHAHGNATATMNLPADPALSPASGSSDNAPALGWQSLLPGSIQ